MTRLTLSLLALVALLAAAFLAQAQAAFPRLKGEVGPGFTIEVEKAGRDVKTLRAGKYALHVEDKSSSHNFHLIGPGLNKKTSVGFKGETTWTVKLRPGRYTYQCDPHASGGMKGRFRVTA
jgi:plastocyanin